MRNELAMLGVHVASPEALGGAIGRAISGLGIGTAIALLLGALVLGVESLPRCPWKKMIRKAPAARKRRGMPMNGS